MRWHRLAIHELVQAAQLARQWRGFPCDGVVAAQSAGGDYLVLPMSRDGQWLGSLFHFEHESGRSSCAAPGAWSALGWDIDLGPPRATDGHPAVPVDGSALLAASDSAKRDPHAPSVFAVDDVFSIPNKGTVVTGQVKRGSLRPGDALEIPGTSPTPTQVTAVKTAAGPQASASLDQAVALELEDLAPDALGRGAILAAPGSLRQIEAALADVFYLSPKDGGLPHPIQAAGMDLSLVWWGRAVGARVVPNDAPLAPGGVGRCTLHFHSPVLVDVDTSLALRHQGSTVGLAIVRATEVATATTEQTALLLGLELLKPWKLGLEPALILHLTNRTANTLRVADPRAGRLGPPSPTIMFSADSTADELPPRVTEETELFHAGLAARFKFETRELAQLRIELAFAEEDGSPTQRAVVETWLRVVDPPCFSTLGIDRARALELRRAVFRAEPGVDQTLAGFELVALKEWLGWLIDGLPWESVEPGLARVVASLTRDRAGELDALGAQNSAWSRWFSASKGRPS